MIHLDFESRSEVDIWTSGAWIYASHPSTEVLCLVYAIDKQKPVLITKDELPMAQVFYPDLFDVIKSGDTITAHNALFETCIWMHQMAAKFNYPSIHPRQWRCSAAKAAAFTLPRSLKNCALAMQTDHQKSISGRTIMLKLCKPRPSWTKTGKGDKWYEDPADMQKLYEYCIDDVLTERDIDLGVPDLNETEQEIWFLDQIINTRGFCVDVQAVDKALAFLENFNNQLNEETSRITNGFIDKVSKRAKVQEWMNAQGVVLENYQQKTVEHAVNDTSIPENVRRILEIRLQLNKISTKKYLAMKLSSDKSGRVRDILVYHGASTGRWAGKLVQIQNLPRGTVADTGTCIDAIKHNSLDFFKTVYPDTMGAISSCIRGMIVSAQGRDLIAADYSAIEARVVMWLAGEIAGINKFKKGEDLYVDMARSIYQKQKISKTERQLGKVAVLGCISGDSEVYSDTGFTSLKNLKKGQKLWDGKQWVSYQEKVNVGKKNVIRIDEVWLTLDHLLLTTLGWQTAGEIALQGVMRPRRLGQTSDSGQLLVQSSRKVKSVMSPCAARAGLLKVAESTSYGEERLANVLDALAVLKGKKVVDRVNMLILSLTQDFVNGSSSVGTILIEDVQTQIIRTSGGMVLEVFRTPSNAVESSWNTLLLWMGMTSGGSPWIELTMTGVIPPTIYDSLLKKKTIKTEIKECYDIIGSDSGYFQVGSWVAHNCGYGMGAAKFQATCKNFGLGISEELAQSAVAVYRDVYSSVKRFWYDMENNALTAVRSYGFTTFGNMKVNWTREKDNLFCILPSGRRLTYVSPEIKKVETPWGAVKPQITFMAVNTINNKWERQSTYGGKLVENITQAVARDIMAHAMLNCEAQGYPVLFTVHDEIVSEVPEGFGTVSEFESILCGTPKWAKGCPINAEGWRGKRYKK